MLIISDCLTDNADEGTIKIASKIAKILKKSGRATVFQINKKSSFSDEVFKTGGSVGLRKLVVAISKENKKILYIPNASMTMGICLKVCALSLFSHKKIFLMPVYRRTINWRMKFLLQISGAELIVLSNESYNVYKKSIRNKIHYVKAGVDIEKFNIVDDQKKILLKEKHGHSENDIIVLHTGHMVEARNLRRLMELDQGYKIILIISTSTRWDDKLYKDISKCKNIKIIHEYIPNIEEYFQMSDVYYFPVESLGCVDVPLSVLEAAACGIPIVTTPYGELKTFSESRGFRFINNFSESSQLIESVRRVDARTNRNMILDYDWYRAANSICIIMEENNEGRINWA